MQLTVAPWSNALQVRMHSGLERRFDSPNEAADFLEHEWPFKDGEKYEQALRTCHEAIERRVSQNVAREAFIAACLEARLEIVTRGTLH
ncbi:DUF982 domain-containing protein [Rhizobium mesosinicum]|uniref:DUF982 domain-containing protein n=1 Tax=Rhizobium mesosinicum TaxID=335017 RepID=A0ABS7GNP0_9HYPH|nr:DUF982 domain-containing protein [Rhizobium mesosinicum]MBW9051025.1 DUF982 domain-containing protein [Rhizobium mesosinicum]